MLSGTALIGTAIGLVTQPKKKSARNQIITFKSILSKYFEELRHGQLQLSTVNILSASLEELKKKGLHDQTSIQLSIADIEILTKIIEEYTMELAKRNQIALQEQLTKEYIDPLYRLMICLNNQKYIFSKVE